VPWIPALVFFLAPAAMLAKSARPLARGLRLSRLLPRSFTPDETVHGIDHSPRGAGSRHQVFRGSSYAGAARAPKQAGDLDFASPGRSGHRSRTRRLRSFVQSGSRFLRFLVELLLLNLFLLEYCVLVAGILRSRRADGRRRTAGALGMLSSASRCCSRTGVDRDETHEFRFYGSARTAMAGADALITA